MGLSRVTHTLDLQRMEDARLPSALCTILETPPFVFARGSPADGEQIARQRGPANRQELRQGARNCMAIRDSAEAPLILHARKRPAVPCSRGMKGDI